ncbi:MAG: D-2-hydroxyacid dehydrogenase [Spirosomaceae bacterium]|nr:D-2-hydroxyacid dehydrogenase [Spirosomataceae bacterium]
MKIVYLDAFPLGNDIDISPLKNLGEYTSHDRTSSDLIIERASGAEIVLTNKCIISAETMDALPDLKYIGVTATGFNIVDTKAAKERGIIVTNASDYSSNSVAQHVFAMILRLQNQIYEHSNADKWTKSPDFCYFNSTINEISGKTLGVVGYGGIGKKVVQIAEAFGMNVLINKRTLNKTDSRMVELDELLSKSDYISLHLPLTADNSELINAASLKKMKSNAVLINTARGGLVNESDLANALNDGIIGGAALDVLSTEPPSLENPLLAAKNCLITPHIAWGSFEARKKLLEIVVENLKAYQQGKPINVVNN